MTHVPIRDAVIIAQADETTVRRWARQERLTTSTDDDGTPLYDIEGLVRCEREDRQAGIRHAYTRLAKRLSEGA